MRHSDRDMVVSEIVELAGTLISDVRPAVERLTEWSGRGYPSGGTGSSSRGHGGSPTEAAAEDRDQHGAEYALIDGGLLRARDALRDVRNAVARSKPVPVASGEQWCRNHTTHFGAKTREPVYRKDLCRFCYDFLNAEQRLPTRTILDARGSGRRITQQLVDRELGRAG